MPWKPFDYDNAPSGLLWLLVESPVFDIDTGDNGETAGTPTDEIRRSAVLAVVEEDHEGYLHFSSVDASNYGRVGEGDVVTHFAELKAPAIPAIN